jgi:hypothetical protein
MEFRATVETSFNSGRARSNKQERSQEAASKGALTLEIGTPWE